MSLTDSLHLIVYTAVLKPTCSDPDGEKPLDIESEAGGLTQRGTGREVQLLVECWPQ